jgi:hypothetical protein
MAFSPDRTLLNPLICDALRQGNQQGFQSLSQALSVGYPFTAYSADIAGIAAELGLASQGQKNLSFSFFNGAFVPVGPAAQPPRPISPKLKAFLQKIAQFERAISSPLDQAQLEIQVLASLVLPADVMGPPEWKVEGKDGLTVQDYQKTRFFRAANGACCGFYPDISAYRNVADQQIRDRRGHKISIASADPAIETPHPNQIVVYGPRTPVLAPRAPGTVAVPNISIRAMLILK